MEQGIIRSMAALCAVGALCLAWAFGAFVAVPVRAGRLLAMDATEVQLVGIPLATGLLVAWGALHLLAMADHASRPVLYGLLRAAFALALAAAAASGATWSLARVVAA